MDIEEGRTSLFYLVTKYLNDPEQIELLRKTIYANPPRVPVRGIFEQLSDAMEFRNLTVDDQELLNKLFHFYG
jgi:hypothetical protein